CAPARGHRDRGVAGGRARRDRVSRLAVPRRGHRLRRRRRGADLTVAAVDRAVEGWTVAQVLAAEEPLLAAGVPLMQRAATALALEVTKVLRERRGRVGGSAVLLLVGGGNNGGDTLHAGAVLARRGATVLAVLTTPRPHAEGLAALLAAGGRAASLVDEDASGAIDAGGAGEHGTDPEPAWSAKVAIPLEHAVDVAARSDVVLDGLLGLGGRGAPRGPAGRLVVRLGDVLAGLRS